MRAKRRRRSITSLIVLFVVILAGLFYFVAPSSMYGFNLWGREHKGLDLVGGLHIVLDVSATPTTKVTADSMKAELNTITRRVNALGLTEPRITQEGSHRIVVDMPGVKDPEQVVDTIGRMAVLEFRDPKTGKTFLSGDHLIKATAAKSPNAADGYVVQMQFDSVGAKKMDDFTKTHIGKLMPIYLDNDLISSPQVVGEISGGHGEINRLNSIDEAQNLAISLNSGALPLQTKIIENRTISASLGADSLSRSVRAIILAAVLVVAFMLVLYRIPGFWADFALAFYALLLLLVLLGLQATLTLPGITGIVLSLGMAVDTNVIIFERIKEELRLGRNLRSAVDLGFNHGFRAVFDSNATTILAAAVLFFLGTGPVKGFAITLVIGVLISMFTAITFTRWILHLQVDAGARPGPWFFGFHLPSEGADAK